MKTITIIFSLFFVFGTVCFSQNKIDKAEFEHLIDYANCQYLMSFIEKNDAGKLYIKNTYKKSVKPVLQKATLGDLNTVPDFEKIKGLFQNNSNKSALQLAEKINSIKTKYDNLQDNDDLIKILTTESWEGIDLTNTATIVQDSIRKKYNLIAATQQEIVNDKTIENVEKGEELHAKDQTLQERVITLERQIKELENKLQYSSNIGVWVTLILTWLVFIILFFVFRKKYSQPTESNREQIITTVLKSQRIAQKFISGQPNKSPQSINLIDNKIAVLETQVKELQKRENNEGRRKNTEENVSDLQSKIDDVKYFKSKNGKMLIEELQNSSDASFKIFNVIENEAKFEYCGGVVNQDFFTDVCSFANNPSDVPNKTKITTMVPGVVKKDSNNIWEVTDKARIKFE